MKHDKEQLAKECERKVNKANGVLRAAVDEDKVVLAKLKEVEEKYDGMMKVKRNYDLRCEEADNKMHELRAEAAKTKRRNAL